MSLMKKSCSVNQELNLIQNFVRKNINSFSDFQKLTLGGSQRVLTFGEYCQKNYNNVNKINRRKEIKYFYKNLRRTK